MDLDSNKRQRSLSERAVKGLEETVRLLRDDARCTSELLMQLEKEKEELSRSLISTQEQLGQVRPHSTQHVQAASMYRHTAQQHTDSMYRRTAADRHRTASSRQAHNTPQPAFTGTRYTSSMYRHTASQLELADQRG